MSTPQQIQADQAAQKVIGDAWGGPLWGNDGHPFGLWARIARKEAAPVVTRNVTPGAH